MSAVRGIGCKCGIGVFGDGGQGAHFRGGIMHVRRGQLLDALANGLWMKVSLLDSTTWNKGSALATVVYPDTRLGGSDQEMIIRERGENGGEDATGMTAMKRNPNDDGGGGILGMVRGDANVKLTGGTVDRGGDKDMR